MVTLIACCLVVIISLGIRQTFGLFYFDFSTDLDITISQFGFAMGLQLFLWGAFNPLFGVITDKYGGNIAIFIGFFFYLSESDFLQMLPDSVEGCKQKRSPLNVR